MGPCRLILEQPWVSSEDLLGPDGDEFVWDFCTEEPGWLGQLVELYAHGRLTTMNAYKNMEPVHEFTREERDAFTKAMLADKWFRRRFVEDYRTADPGLKARLKDVLPQEFYEEGLV